MFLYRTQPKTTDTNNIINLHSKETMLRGIRDVTPTFGGKSPHRNDFITLFTDGCVLDGMLTLAGYDNILVVTSFEDNNYERLRDRNYRPVNSAGDHMLPIIHKLNGSHGNIYVTKVLNGDSFYSKLYDQYDIKTVDSNSYFKIDGDLKPKLMLNLMRLFCWVVNHTRQVNFLSRKSNQSSQSIVSKTLI